MAETTRRLAAILSADVAGYSRLMGADEAATVAALEESRAIFRDHIAAHRGRVVDTAGDNVLAVFDSVVEAVACAVEIQGRLADRNASLPEDRRMLFLKGLAWGLSGILRAVPFNSAQRRLNPPTEMTDDIVASALRHLEAARQIQTGLPRKSFGAILPVACVHPYLERLARAGGDPFHRGLELSRLTRQWRMTMSALRGRI